MRTICFLDFKLQYTNNRIILNTMEYQPAGSLPNHFIEFVSPAKCLKTTNLICIDRQKTWYLLIEGTLRIKERKNN